MKSVDKQAYFRKINYEPHRGGQTLFHASKARFKVAVCGRRYGKSTQAAREIEPRLLTPNQMGWIVGPTYDLGEKEFRIIWDDMMVKLGLGADKRIKKGFNKRTGTMFITFPWNTHIEVRSADHPENLVGEKLDFVIMAEAAKHRRETWERYIRPALADKNGDAIFCTTPEGMNWIYDLYLLGQDPRYQLYDSWRMPSWDNHVVFPGGRNDPEILSIEETTSVEWFAQEIGAEFTSFVGKIYPEFDELVHIKPITYNPAISNYNFWDWGFVNPLAMLDVQVDAFDNIYIWREHYQASLRLEDHIEVLKARGNPDGYKVDGGYADAEDPEAVQTVNLYWGPCIALPEAKENWRAGVETVKRFLKLRSTGQINPDTGEPILAPKLYIDPSCVNTIKEFQNYRMAPEPRTGTDPQEKAKKRDDHSMDALRYGLVHIFELGAKHHLNEVMENPIPSMEDRRPDQFVVADLGLSSEGIFTKGKVF